ncbi:Adenylate cyclase type 8 [Tupaia chinensis]|uniref:Adenylate cyclase type 8 n=1 Tax=Tupaia chinensis TaxID=246437 RepID=L9JLN6_TUPCH|nr:Adenylate cyclase type 8 [Tupaia chinensis]
MDVPAAGSSGDTMSIVDGIDCQHVVAQAVLFMCMNTAGIFISYLSDRAQRQAFLETRRCVEARLRLETENQRQVVVRIRDEQVLARSRAGFQGGYCDDKDIGITHPCCKPSVATSLLNKTQIPMHSSADLPGFTVLSPQIILQRLTSHAVPNDHQLPEL